MTSVIKKRIFPVVLIAMVLLSGVVSAKALPDRIITDIEYGKVGKERLLIDACVPDRSGVNPVVILVHGGGWVGGDKRDMHFLFEPLSEAGFTCFSVKYRLAPEYRWPACFEDVQAAVRWVKANASDFNGDPERIALLGYSAGGHLACMAAVDESVQAVIGISPPTDHLADSARRGGLSECLQKLFDYPKDINTESKKLLEQISPINYVSSKLPPYLLVHGTADKSVPYSQSIAFKKCLNEKGVKCDLITIQDAPHRISDWYKYEGGDFKPAMIKWLKTIIATADDVSASKKVIMVKRDGTGDFTTVQAAVEAIPNFNNKPVTIKIEPGVYKEKIVVPRSKRFVRFEGKDAKTTVLTFDLNARIKDETGNEIGTFRTPSVTIEASDFVAENITFENSSGPVGQALAMAVLGDRVTFRHCRFLGWQDTLLDQTGRHYYENCYIAGNCDFIFGGGTAFFEKCQIHCLDGNYITAASTPENQEYGYVFSNCKITGENDKIRTHLGRPWRDYADVFFLNTEMSGIIRSEGWHNWGKPHREKTARYCEYRSTGSGARSDKRVEWSRQLTKEQAEKITIHSVLSGDDGWNPITEAVESSLKIDEISEENAESVKKILNLNRQDNKVFLATCWSSDDQDALYFAHSVNGLEWIEVGGPFLTSNADAGKAFKGANLLRGKDGVFHIVWQTATKGDQGFAYANSKDLIHWSDQKKFDLMNSHKAFDVVNPRLFYDQTADHYIVTWASTLPGNYFQCYQEPVENNPRLWYSVTKDFSQFSPAEIFLEPGYAVEDAVIVNYGSGYALVHEDSRNTYRTLRTAFGDLPVEAWKSFTDEISPGICENPAVLSDGSLNLVYYQTGHKAELGLLVTEDFNTWINVANYVSFPEQYLLGNIVKVDRDIVEGLKKHQLVAKQKSGSLVEKIAPINAPFAMDDMKLPVFPDVVFDIREYGAVADGTTYNTKAFSDAIEACAEVGGGHVMVPEGKWFTGPIHLKSNIDLHLSEGAEIIFSDRFEDYLPVVLVRVGGIEIYNYSPLIYARDCENVAVTGQGKLKGNAKHWWDEMLGNETKEFFEMGTNGVPVEKRIFGTPEAAIRPSFLSLVNCRNILLEGFTIGSGPNWTIHPIYCENVIIRFVNVITDGPNNDGIDPDSCKNVLIENCVFDTGDDCVVLKSGYNEDGWRVGRPTENVVMRYCTSKRGHGGLVIGSEMSGDVRNIYMHDCSFEGTDRAVRIKSKRGRGGVVENVWVRDIKLKNMQREAVIFNMVYSSDRKEASNQKAPIFRNFDIRNLTCDGASTGILMRAVTDSPIENVYFENIKIFSDKGIICENVRNIVFDNVSVNNRIGPVYQITNGVDLKINKNAVPNGTKIFIEVKGKASSNIRISDSDLSNVSEIVLLKDGASKEAVASE